MPGPRSLREGCVHAWSHVPSRGGMPGPRSVSVEGGILEGWRYTTGRGVIPGGGYTTLGGYTYPSSCT